MQTTSRPPKTAVLVAQRIMRDAVREHLRPGDSLPPERVMLLRYETGRATLRESLRLLEFQGVISIKPGSGGGPVLLEPNASHLAGTLALVMQLKNTPLRSVIEVRAAVEPVISTLAAARIEPDALGALAATIDDMRREVADRYVFLEANKRFHHIVSRASGNPLFSYIIESVLDIMDGMIVNLDYPLRYRSAIVTAHRAIHTALASGDAAAGELMRHHIGEYQRYLEQRFPDALDRVVQWHGR